ncbi:MAG: AI-2E family transporter [Gemmataceae bacterium]|nr:AI-2E family transporter [Gemmataceae bacterium]
MLPFNTASRIGLSVLLLLTGVVGLYLGEPVFVPLLISLMLATVLGPAAAWLHQTLKIRWSLACITVVILLVVANLLITTVFAASVARVVNQLSDEKKVKEAYNEFRTKLEKMSPGPLDEGLFPKNPESINQIGILQYIKDAVPYVVGQTAKYGSLWSWRLIVTLFITFFILLEGRMLARRAVAIFGPSDEVQAKATEVLIEMANQVRTYLVWRTIINLGLAIVMGVVYQMADLSQAWTWAILLAVLNYIPYFGPVLASIPPFLDAFILSNPAVALVVFIIFWVVIVLEGYLIVPLVMGRNMDLNATTVMLACMLWEAVWGMTGLFLAMPIMAAIKAILHHNPEWRVWADLMSSTDDPMPHPSPPTATLAPTPAGADLPNGKPDAAHAESESQRSA